MQEILTRPGMLERFLPDINTSELEDLRESWVNMWALDVPSTPSSPSLSGIEAAKAHHAHLVLKPQREGGGNNVYTSSIPQFLSTLPPSEYKAWIAMEMIQPPAVEGLMIRSGTGSVVRGSVVSEIGIFGWALFGGNAEKGEIKMGEDVGWLVRTKGKESNEGGVAVGFSVLDSLILVD